jgi:nucleoside phosphorylase
MNNSVTRFVVSVFVLGFSLVFAQKLNETPRLAVMSAYEPEWQVLLETIEVRTAEKPEIEYRFWFQVDPQMLETARSIADPVELATCNAENLCLSHDPKSVIGGNGVSGQTFVDNAAFREWTFETFQAQVLDMETLRSCSYCASTSL